MGSKRAKVISRDAFMQAFVEAEVRMRKALSDKIQESIDKETNEDVKSGLKQAQVIIFGVTE
jgi:hypothetical protein